MQVKEICSRTKGERGGGVSNHDIYSHWQVIVCSLIRSQCSGMRKFARSFVHSFVFFFLLVQKTDEMKAKNLNHAKTKCS